MHQYATGRPDAQDAQALQRFSHTIWVRFQDSQVGNLRSFRATGPTKRPEEPLWFPKPGVNVCNADCAPRNVRHRQSAGRTQEKPTARNVFPVCAASHNVLMGRERSMALWFRRWLWQLKKRVPSERKTSYTSNFRWQIKWSASFSIIYFGGRSRPPNRTMRFNICFICGSSLRLPDGSIVSESCKM